MTGLAWFRMYTEFATDPDVQSLAFEDQRHYVILLCLKGNGTLDKDYPSADRRFAVIRRTLGLDSVAIDECKRRLIEAGLIDHQWQPRGWDKRQFVSDNSTLRVREFRERQRNVSETRSDTETDSETETEKRESAQSAPSPPKRRASKRCPQEFQVTADLMAWAEQKAPGVDVAGETEKFRDHEFRNAHTDWDATWRQWMRRASEGVSTNGSRQQVTHQRRPSAVERVYAATADQCGDDGIPRRLGVAVDG